MAGEAKTNKFMLGTATVMIGAQADLFNLNPDDDSIGLVKNFQISASPTYTELTQGVKNSVVYSVMTGNPTDATMEVYEYTSKTLSYGLGLDGSALAPTTVSTTTNAAIVANIAGTSVIPVAAVTGFAAGDWVQVAVPGLEDKALIAKIKTIDATAKTLTVADTQKFDYGMLVNAIVTKVNVVGIGQKVDQPFLAAKVVGSIADGTTVALLLPKVRIVSGFTLAFKTDSYGNLPYKMSLYDQVATDPFYTDFAGLGQGILTTVS